MATIHMSEAEAARNFEGLMKHVREGSEVVIEDGATPVALLSPPKLATRGIPASETLRILEERGSKVTLDDHFGKDLEAIISSHQEPLRNPWE